MLESTASVGDILAGRRILVVEDEYLTADEIVHTLRGSGCEVLGAVPSVKKALALIQSASWLDAAVIDVKLASELSYPVADALIARRTPFVFTTIYNRDQLPERYRDAPHCAKPMQPMNLLLQLREALARLPADSPSGGANHGAERRPSFAGDGPFPGAAGNISQWVQRIARDRDREAFAELFLAVAPKVKSYMLRRGMTASLAEDLAQEVLLTVWKKAEIFDPGRAEPMAWIFTIARNLRVDLHRREHRGEHLQPDWAASSHQATPEEIVGANIDSRRAHEALGELPPAQAEVLRRSFLDGQTHGEIARALGLPPGTVKSRLRLAMARLRAKLADADS